VDRITKSRYPFLGHRVYRFGVFARRPVKFDFECAFSLNPNFFRTWVPVAMISFTSRNVSLSQLVINLGTNRYDDAKSPLFCPVATRQKVVNRDDLFAPYSKFQMQFQNTLREQQRRR
jgi:hypothetical protein